jgi:transcriptional regulator with GAF, ATPase, and Fis domain
MHSTEIDRIRIDPDTGERLLEGERGPRVSLVVEHEGSVKAAVLEPERPLVVGREPPSGLCVPDKTLSRRHARFTFAGGRVIVEDLGSTNGTWIAGRRVACAEIDVGSTVRLARVRARVHLLVPAAGGAARDREACPPPRPDAGEGEDGPVFASPRMLELIEVARRVAASRVPVILRGETGTGKEVIARLLHEAGPRRSRRMVRVNCGAIPGSLVEGTLFGHEKGAFTGAVSQQRGVFEEADGGTVFLDEIGELPLAAQAALLRVLETGAFCRVGSSHEITVDVRVVAATHRDLDAMAAAGSFRADLYYRLGAVTLEIPPLRERREEIGRLATRFLRAASRADGRPVMRIEPEALERLVAYDWPGNVRELKNAVERAVVVALGSAIGVRDLPLPVQAAGGSRDDGRKTASVPPPAPSAEGDLRDQMRRHEAALLEEALRAAGWSVAEAARRLHMPRRTLAYKIKMLGLKKPDA